MFGGIYLAFQFFTILITGSQCNWFPLLYVFYLYYVKTDHREVHSLYQTAKEGHA